MKTRASAPEKGTQTMIDTQAHGERRVSHIVTLPVTDAHKGGKYSSDQISFQEGTTEYTFRKGFDGTWRYVFVSEYGNTSFVTGDAVGPSGFNVTDARSVKHLNALFARFAK